MVRSRKIRISTEGIFPVQEAEEMHLKKFPLPPLDILKDIKRKGWASQCKFVQESGNCSWKDLSSKREIHQKVGYIMSKERGG